MPLRNHGSVLTPFLIEFGRDKRFCCKNCKTSLVLTDGRACTDPELRGDLDTVHGRLVKPTKDGDWCGHHKPVMTEKKEVIV